MGSDVMFFDNTLRKIANDKGYKVGYDNKTDSVIVENPLTGKKISFKSGQGQEYGMGGLDADMGYNVVSDVSLLEKALAADPKPKAAEGNYFTGAANNYASPYSDQINDLIGKITNYKPFDYSSYNPQDDAAFQQFEKNAIKSGNRAYADTFAGTAIPGVAESSVGRQIAETARKGYTDQIQNAIPTFMEKARQDYESAYNRNFDVLNTLTDLDAYSLDRQGAVQKNLANEAKTIALANYDNIAAEINRRREINPNDPLIPYLEAERQNKIFTQDAAKAEAESAEAKRAQTLFDQAMKQWQTSGIASKSVADILGIPVGSKTADYSIASINAANRGSSGGSGGGSDTSEKSNFTTTQIYNQAKKMLGQRVDTGRRDADGKPITRPRYTQEEFDTWLSSMLPDTPEGDRLFDEIISMLGSVEYWDTSNPATVSQEALRRQNKGIVGK
jgi:hypothetical protein